MGLLIRGLMGAKPPTVKLVTSLGWTRRETRYKPPPAVREQQGASGRRAGTHLGSARQHQVARLANEHAAVLHQLFTVEEGEAPEQVTDLPLTTLREEGQQEVTWPTPAHNRKR